MTVTAHRSVDLILEHASILPMTDGAPVLAGHAVAISGQRIEAVGTTEEIARSYRAERSIDCRGNALLPGLVDAHVHTCQQLGRGLADDMPVLEWLTKIVSLEDEMGPDEVRVSVELACLEMIKSGTTAFIEACANPNFMDIVGEAVAASGLRAALTRSTMQEQEPDWRAPRGFLMSHEANLAATRELLDRWNGAADGRIAAWCGWRQQWNLSDELLVDLVKMMREYGVGLHGHLATRRYGQIEFLDRLGVLGPDMVFAHAIRFTERERDLIAHYDVKINHNPAASMHGAYGSAVAGSFPELHDRGVCVCLGCDGAANGNTLDMWQITRLAATLHKEVRQEATVISAPEALRMATVNGARALQRSDLGTIEPGQLADLQVVDLYQPHLLPLNDIVANLVYCASGQDVVTTIVDGRVLMEDRKVFVLDESRILAEAIDIGERLAGRVRAGQEAGA